MNEKENRHFSIWKAWIVVILINQILMAFQNYQQNQKLWDALIQTDDVVVWQMKQWRDYLESQVQHQIEENEILRDRNRNLEQALEGLDQVLRERQK